MYRTLLKSKIHRATVTDVNVHYEGSVTIDRELLEAADIVEHEQVQIYDITNGARLTSYAITGAAGSSTIGINGAAARLVQQGDLVIIASYAQYEPSEVAGHRPRIVRVDRQNRLQQAPAGVVAGEP